jgi:expansin (peptidoglycan-binding protein)
MSKRFRHLALILTFASAALLGLFTAACSGDDAGEGATGGTGGTSGAGDGALGTGGGRATDSSGGGTTVLTACNAECVDVLTDRENCGDCGVVCELGADCVAGECTGCPDGLESCSGVCSDTGSSEEHCGSCGVSCDEGELCIGGTCTENTCSTDVELPCDDGQCVNVQYSNTHCGGCDIACDGEGEWCEPERLAGDASVAGVSRCRCADGQTKCAGKCTGLNYDRENCGACGVKCVGSQYCDNGQCRCGGASQVLCNGDCREPAQCTAVSGGVAARAPLELPRFEFLQAAVGDGSIECGGDDGGDGTGTTTGTIGGNPDAGAHCGGGDWHTGKATWYTLATPLVHCGYPTETLPEYYGAMNDAEYGTADVCGACVEVQAEGKTLQIQITDECPYEGNERWCFAGSNHIDLSPAAFQYFADPVQGVLDIEWRYVPCTDVGDLEVTYKDGSSIYWTGVLVRNHPVPITSVEIQKGGSWVALARQEYNYWLDESGFGPGPYTLRITDSSGAVIEKGDLPTLTGTPLATTSQVDLGVQLASCN